jgi:hypothetical protein
VSRSTETTPAAVEPGLGFWIGLAAGLPMVGYGAFELIRQTGWPRAFGVARWLGGGLLLHDFVLVPTVLVIVWVAGRGAPPWLRNPLRAGLLASALVVAVAWPGLRGYGDKPDNATIHPLDYETALLTVLAVVWAAMLAWMVWSLASRGTPPSAAAPPAGDPGSLRTSRTPAPD